MGEIREISFNLFNYGMPDEKRDLANGFFRYLENLAVGDKAREISQVGDIAITTDITGNTHRTILNEVYVNGVIYGVGNSAAVNGKFSVWKSSDNGATWSTSVPADDATFVAYVYPFFTYYQGFAYFLNGNYIGRYTISSGAMSGHFANPGVPLQGGVEWKGDFYGWNAQTVYKITTGGAATSMITIPIDQSIVEIVPYGNYLAIVCNSANLVSKMYLWDGVTTTSFYDIIDIGYGTVAGAAIVDGIIKAVIGSSAGSLHPNNFRIKKYVAGIFETEYIYNGRDGETGDNFVYLISRVKSYNGFLYFLIGATRPNVTTTTGSYSVQLARYGHKTSDLRNAFCIYKDFEFVPSSITRGTANYNDFLLLDFAANYVSVLANVEDTASTPTLKQILTKIDATYNQSGVIETGIYTGISSHIKKNSIAASLMCNALLSGGQIVAKYKVDNDSAWTTFMTLDEDGIVSKEAVNIEATGQNLPEFKEIQFRFEITGNPSPTAFIYKYEEQLSEV